MQVALLTGAAASLSFLVAQGKVIHAGQREAALTTAHVLLMVAIASVFFLVADQLMRLLITYVLGIGS
jgi:preprotein translocase subunit SecE